MRYFILPFHTTKENFIVRDQSNTYHVVGNIVKVYNKLSLNVLIIRNRFFLISHSYLFHLEKYKAMQSIHPVFHTSIWHTMQANDYNSYASSCTKSTKKNEVKKLCIPVTTLMYTFFLLFLFCFVFSFFTVRTYIYIVSSRYCAKTHASRSYVVNAYGMKQTLDQFYVPKSYEYINK